MLCDISAGIVHVAGEHLAQLVQPFPAFRAIGRRQRVHGQHIHVVIVAQGGFLLHPVPEPGVVDDVVAAHQPGQVEGLGWGVDGGGTLPGVLADALGGDVPGTVQDEIRPNFVGHHVDIVLAEQFHGPFQLPTLPHPAAGIVGRAEHRRVDAVFHDFFLHVLKIHAPHAVLIQDQRAVDDVVAVVGEAAGEADVSGRVEQHLVPLGTKHIQRGDHPAQHTVFVSNVPFGQPVHAVPVLVPADNRVVVIVGGGKVPEGGVLGTLDNGGGDGWDSGKVHVRHPHGNGVEALPGRAGSKASGCADGVHGDGVPAMAVHDGGKIIFHRVKSFL